jgi:hypothetical protein
VAICPSDGEKETFSHPLRLGTSTIWTAGTTFLARMFCIARKREKESALSIKTFHLQPSYLTSSVSSAPGSKLAFFRSSLVHSTARLLSMMDR